MRTGPRSFRHPHLVAFVIFAGVICGVYFSVLTGHASLRTNGPFPPGPLFVADPSAGGAITLPLERLVSSAWSHLQFPLVDPYQGYGIPLLASQGVPVYPPQLLVHLVFPHNYSIWNVVNLIAFAFGSYLLASSLGQRFLAAMAVGTAAALAGVAPPNLDMAMLNPLALAPFLLLCLRHLLDPESPHSRVAWLGAVTTVALLCLSGFQEVLPLLAVLAVVFGVAMVVHFRTLQLRPRLLGSTALAGVLGVVTGSVGLISTLAIFRSNSSLNTPGSYAPHETVSWLSTLTIPGIAGSGLAAQRSDVGETIWTLGTPLLVVVLALAVVLAVRRAGREARWYLWPSCVLSVYGFLAYADVGHVLKVFDIPVFTSIVTVRFLQFVWWPAWCLLLGAVISHVRSFRWFEAIGALAVAGLVDLLLLVKFRHHLEQNHLNGYLGQTVHAAVLALAVMGLFVAVVILARWAGAPLAAAGLALLVLASCLYYLPTNFYPAGSDTASTALAIPGVDNGRGASLVFAQTSQEPTTGYDVQIWGPVIPRPYLDLSAALFSAAETAGYGPLFSGGPTFAWATLDGRTIDVLRALGVDVLVSAARVPAPTFGAVPPCTSPRPVSDTALCYLGRSTTVGGPHVPLGFAYRIQGASPLVEPVVALRAVAADDVGLRDLLAGVSSTSHSLAPTGYVTTGSRHPVAAQGVAGISRQASTESVTVTLRSATTGLVVLREAYMTGVRVTVNGRRASAMAADGGLWTAVAVGPGVSRIDLDYTTAGVEAQFALAAGGLVLIVAAWCAAATVWARSRDGRRRRH